MFLFFMQVIHTHFWLKRKEICAQIEGWIEELCKPEYSERSSRTISFNSMVLRRQYRHLREELSKLKVPEGLEDLDEPFNPNVTLPAMTESSGANTNAGNGSGSVGGGGSVIANTNAGVALKTTNETSLPPNTSTLPTMNSQNQSPQIPEFFKLHTSNSANAQNPTVTIQQLAAATEPNNSTFQPLEININQPFVITTVEDSSESPAMLSPHPPMPAAVQAKLVTVPDTAPATDTASGQSKNGSGSSNNNDNNDIDDDDDDEEDSNNNRDEDHLMMSVDEIIAESQNDDDEEDDDDLSYKLEIMEQLFFESSENAMHYDE